MRKGNNWLQAGGAAPFERRRRRQAGILLLLVLLSFGLLTQAQDGDQESTVTATQISSSSSSSSSISGPTPSASVPVDATTTPYRLTESVSVQAILDVTSSSPAQFYLPMPFKNASQHLFVSASLCSGPAIPPYDISDLSVLTQLKLNSYQASVATLPRLYVSTDQVNQRPGPNQLGGKPDMQYFVGGFAQDESTDRNPDGAWITIWPPADTRSVTGRWTLTLAASTEGAPASLRSDTGLYFADSDADTALFTSYNYTLDNPPNSTLFLLPTSGPGSLSDAYYFNSSLCAVTNAFTAFNVSTNRSRPAINSSDTQRGLSSSTNAMQRRLQWHVANLDRGTNYTAWLIDYGKMGSTTRQKATLYPAVKFMTKSSSNCRLVYDVDFCPEVAYSIPVSPDVSTQRALDIINRTVSPNMNNFTATVDSFPCGSKDFGQYSPVQTCDSCKDQYQDWLCAVTMPRCVDALPQINANTTAAIPDPLTLNGTETEINPGLLPYIINRRGNSRQSYIDDANGLNAGLYGELLPCIYTCYFVSRSCPAPLVQWACPLWDISAQSDYGTFADLGIYAGNENDGQRWGGPRNYISQDAFGNLYCNSMGTDLILRQINAAMMDLPLPSVFISSFLFLFTSLTMTFL